MNDTISVNYPVEAGMLIRGRVKRTVLGLCAAHSVNVRVTESFGLLESLYIFHMSGDRGAIGRVIRQIKEWEKQQS
jgi:hypothetical protein